MRKVKLRVVVIPQIFGPAAEAYVAHHPPIRFLHLTTADVSLLTLQNEIIQRYSRLYSNQGHLYILKLQDSSGCDLDPDFAVNDVFSHNDEVRVILPARHDVYLPPTTPRDPYLSSNNPDGGNGFFHTLNPHIPIKELKSPSDIAQGQGFYDHVHLAADASKSPVLAPPKSLNVPDIPVKRPGSATDTGVQKSRRITSGMLTSPPLNGNVTLSPEQKQPSPPNANSTHIFTPLSDTSSRSVSPHEKEDVQCSPDVNNINVPKTDLSNSGDTIKPRSLNKHSKSRSEVSKKSKKESNATGVGKNRNAPQRRNQRKPKQLAEGESNQAHSVEQKPKQTASGDDYLTKNMILDLYQEKMDLGDQGLDFLDEHAQRVIRSLSIDMVDSMRQPPRGPRRAATRACTLMKEPKRQTSKSATGKSRRTRVELDGTGSDASAARERIAVDLEDDTPVHGRTGILPKNSPLTTTQKSKATKSESLQQVVPHHEKQTSTAQAVNFFARILARKFNDLTDEPLTPSGSISSAPGEKIRADGKLQEVSPSCDDRLQRMNSLDSSNTSRPKEFFHDESLPHPGVFSSPKASSESNNPYKEFFQPKQSYRAKVPSKYKVPSHSEELSYQREAPSLKEVSHTMDFSRHISEESPSDITMTPAPESDVEMVPYEEGKDVARYGGDVSRSLVNQRGSDPNCMDFATHSNGGSASAVSNGIESIAGFDRGTIKSHSGSSLFVKEYTSLDESAVESAGGYAIAVPASVKRPSEKYGEEFSVPTQIENNSFLHVNEKSSRDGHRDSRHRIITKPANKTAFDFNEVDTGDESQRARTSSCYDLPLVGSQPRDVSPPVMSQHHEVQSTENMSITAKGSKHRISTDKSFNQSVDELGSDSDSDSASDHETVKKPRLVASTPVQSQSAPTRVPSSSRPKSTWLTKILVADKSPISYGHETSSSPPNISTLGQNFGAGQKLQEPNKPIITALDKLKAQGIPQVREKPTEINDATKSKDSVLASSASETESDTSSSEGSSSSEDSSSDHGNEKFLKIEAVAPPKKKKSSIFKKMTRK